MLVVVLNDWLIETKLAPGLVQHLDDLGEVGKAQASLLSMR